MTTDIPEDLNNMIQKATIIRRHLAKNKKDSVNKRSQELIVSKVNRSAKYYKKRANGQLPNDWKYMPKTVGVV